MQAVTSANLSSNANAPILELTQDISTSSTVAQGATVNVYFTSDDEQGWLVFLNRVLLPEGENGPTVLTSSFTLELGDDSSYIGNLSDSGSLVSLMTRSSSSLQLSGSTSSSRSATGAPTTGGSSLTALLPTVQVTLCTPAATLGLSPSAAPCLAPPTNTSGVTPTPLAPTSAVPTPTVPPQEEASARLLPPQPTPPTDGRRHHGRHRFRRKRADWPGRPRHSRHGRPQSILRQRHLL